MLPPNWIIVRSSKVDKHYYFNTITKESRWEQPLFEGMNNKLVRPVAWLAAVPAAPFSALLVLCVA